MTMLLEARATVRQGVRLTAEEFLRLPDSKGLELVDGKLVEKAMGALASEVGAEIACRLKNHCRTTRQGRVFDAECGYRMFPERPNLVRKPDVSLVVRERVPATGTPDGYFALAPDLAIEVISPNDLLYEVDEKVGEYLRAGVREVWVVNPKQRTVQIRRPDRKDSTLAEDDRLTCEHLLPGFECAVSEFFPD